MNAKVWTAVATQTVVGSVHVLRLNGDNGQIEEDVHIPELHPGSYGIYGGAVDARGNFWFTMYGLAYGGAPEGAKLGVVYHDDLDYRLWSLPDGSSAYGFAMDRYSRPWIGAENGNGSLMFDPADESWHLIDGAIGFGLQGDGVNSMWLATSGQQGVAIGLQRIDIDTLMADLVIPIPSGIPRGVSIDGDGQVWFVDTVNSVFRYDPLTSTYKIYDQLDDPYTYSDMTGWGLNSVTDDPPG